MYEECGKVGFFTVSSSTGSIMSLVSSTVIFSLVMFGAYLSGQTPRNVNVLLSEWYSQLHTY